MAIIICLLLVAYNNFTRLGQANAWDNHTLQVLLAGDQVEQAADHIQGAYLAFLIGGSESGLADLEKNRGELEQWIKEAKRLTTDNPSQQARLMQIENDAQEWFTARVFPRIEKRREFNKKLITADQYMHDPIMTGGFSRVQILHKTLDAFEAEEKTPLGRTQPSGQ